MFVARIIDLPKILPPRTPTAQQQSKLEGILEYIADHFGENYEGETEDFWKSVRRDFENAATNTLDVSEETKLRHVYPPDISVEPLAVGPAPRVVLPPITGLHPIERPISLGPRHTSKDRLARRYVNTQHRQTKFEDLTVGCLTISLAHPTVSNQVDNRSFRIGTTPESKLLYLCRVEKIVIATKEVKWRYLAVHLSKYYRAPVALRSITADRASKPKTWIDGDTQTSVFSPDEILLHWVNDAGAGGIGSTKSKKAREIPKVQMEVLRIVLSAIELVISNILSTECDPILLSRVTET
jgi:hypothetical protein